MENINVAIRNIRTQRHCLAKAKKSALHSVGNRAEVGNPIDELSPNNKLFVLGEEMTNGDEARIKVENYIENLKPVVKYSPDDVLNRTHQKKKVRKWLQGKRTTEEEKEIFNQIMDRLENEQNIENDLLSGFKDIKSKISRINDKIKALESLQKSHNKINRSEKRGNQLDVLTIEKVFKITHTSDFEMTSKDQREMQQEFHEKHFPDYPIIYLAEHNDEGKPHCHLMHSGKNSKTGAFDYPDAEAQLIQNRMVELGIESTAIGKKWAKYTEKELKQHGEIWQSMNYEMANQKLKELGITDKQFKKLEGEAKLIADQKMKNDPMAKKAITNRAFNNAKLNEIKAKESIKIAKNNALKINIQRDVITTNNKKIEEQRTILDRFKKEYKKFILSGKTFLNRVLNKMSEEKIDAAAQATADRAVEAVKSNPRVEKPVVQMVDWITEKSESDKVKEAIKKKNKNNNSFKP